MTKPGTPRLAVTFFLATLATACAVRPVPDPRAPGMVRDGPVALRVCIVNGDGAHLAIGDRVEFDTTRLGRLRIRHIPSPNNDDGAWNGGDAVRVRSAVLVESLELGIQQSQRAGQTRRGTRRFVPVGRFRVRLDGAGNEHAPFDFMLSQTTTPTRDHEFPECNADVGDDEFVIRGIEDDDRHGGRAILR